MLQVSILEPLFASYFFILEQSRHYKRLFLQRVFFVNFQSLHMQVDCCPLHLKSQAWWGFLLVVANEKLYLLEDILADLIFLCGNFISAVKSAWTLHVSNHWAINLMACGTDVLYYRSEAFNPEDKGQQVTIQKGRWKPEVTCLILIEIWTILKSAIGLFGDLCKLILYCNTDMSASGCSLWLLLGKKWGVNEWNWALLLPQDFSFQLTAD